MAPADRTVIRVEDLSFGGQNGGFKTLRFTIKEGEIVALAGCRGSGKTTLLKVLGRAAPASAGRAYVRRRTGLLFDPTDCTQPDLTLRENVRLYASLCARPQPDAAALTRAALAFGALEPWTNTPLGDCPGEVVLRLAASLLVTAGHEAVLVDECLEGTDAAFQDKCHERLAALARDGAAIVFVTNDVTRIRRRASRCLVLDGGRLVADGAPDSALTALRGGAAPAAFADEPNSFATLLSAGLFNASLAPIGQARESEDFVVKAVFELAKGESAEVYLTVRRHGAVVFRAGMQEPVALDGGGAYETTVLVPGNVLPPGWYRVTFGVTVRTSGEARLRKFRDAFDFTVATHDGVSSPAKLRWTMNKLAADAAQAARGRGR